MAMAVLNGSITDDGGLDCEGRFVYGYTVAFGLATTWRNNLRTGDTFSERIFNLRSGVTVYFQAQARNALGTVVGTTLTLTTLTDEPKVRTAAATDVSTAGATLNGEIIDNSGIPCRVCFEYGGTTAYGNKTPWLGGYAIGTFAAVIADISPGSGIHYRAVAKNPNGVGYGQDMSFNGLEDRGGASGLPLEEFLLLREGS